MIHLLKVICNGNVSIAGYVMFNLCRDAEHTFASYMKQQLWVLQLEI